MLSIQTGPEVCQLVRDNEHFIFYYTILLVTVFLLIKAPTAIQNIDREPIFCTEFAKQKVYPIFYSFIYLFVF